MLKILKTLSAVVNPDFPPHASSFICSNIQEFAVVPSDLHLVGLCPWIKSVPIMLNPQFILQGVTQSSNLHGII